MGKYLGFYKCRRCGEKFVRVEMQGFDEMFDNMADFVAGENPVLPKLFAYHFCNKSDTNIMALADFIGFEKEHDYAKTND